ncbi:MAG: methyltransferase domain-containing protein [Bradyrhizobium sp.]|nr:MAG: methyltransferase domain-containing protein [Bradyrhizobium sp.]
MLEQTLERAPAWPPALFALAEAKEKLGARGGARAAFAACLAADPGDAQGAAARLALLGEDDAARGLPSAYVARLFDDYAPRFERHLTQDLAYRGPALILETIEAAAPGRRFARSLDLGCGTGLAGEALRSRVDWLEGVDLSSAMLAKARRRALYDALGEGEIVDRLRRRAAEFDLLVAADVLVYFGDLSALFTAAAAALAPSGLFAFTVETHSGAGYRLQPSLRFAHARAYVETQAAAAGLSPIIVTDAWARREAGTEVPGLAAAFAR